MFPGLEGDGRWYRHSGPDNGTFGTLKGIKKISGRSSSEGYIAAVDGDSVSSGGKGNGGADSSMDLDDDFWVNMGRHLASVGDINISSSYVRYLRRCGGIKSRWSDREESYNGI